MMNESKKSKGGLLPRISVNRPVTVTMCLVALLVVGIVALTRIQMEAFPSGLEPKQLWVWAGSQENSSPRENDEQISQPMVEHLQTVKGLRLLWSSCGIWGANARLEFRNDVDMAIAYGQVVDAVERLKLVLPREVRDNVGIWKYNKDTDETTLWIGVSIPAEVENHHGYLQAHVQHRLERIDGVAGVQVWGGPEKEVVVVLDQGRLKTRGVGAYELVQALRADNFEMGSGAVHEGGKKLYVRSVARYGSLDEIERIPIRNRTGTVRVEEVADVFYEVPFTYWNDRIDGRPGVSLGVIREPGTNIVEVSRRVAAELERIEAQTDIQFRIYFNQGKLIRESIENLGDTGLWGGIFAALVLLFFLRGVRMTALITLAIPFCVMTAVAALYFMGWTLNLLTMMGLMVAVGMVVDNAIVVVENIYRMRVKAEDPHLASIRGATEVGLAITIATLTTIVVFLPLMLMSNEAELSHSLSRIGLPVIVALLGSLFMALFFIPLAAKKFGGGTANGEPGSIGRARKVYERGLKWTLTHRKDAVLIVLVLSATMVYPIGEIKRSDSMRENPNDIRIRVAPPPFFTREDISNLGAEIEAFLDNKREVYGIRTVQLRYRLTGSSRLYFRVYLKEEENRAWWYQVYGEVRKRVGTPIDSRMDRKAVIEDLRKTMPRFVGNQVVVESGSGSNPYIYLRLWGDDLETGAKLLDEIELRVESIPSVVGVLSDLERGENEVQVHVDRERARKHGISSQVVAKSITYQLGGVKLPRYRSDEREVGVRLYLRDIDRQTLTQLKNFTFPSKSGELIPLSAFATFEVAKGAPKMYRANGKIRLLLKIFTTKDDLKGLYEEIDDAMEGFQMPHGYTWDKSERYTKFKESEETMTFAVILAITFVFLLMGILFESLILPFSVLVCIPFAFLGVYWTLYLTDTVMDRMAQVGMIVLIGVVVNNAIVLVDRVNRVRAEGKDRTEAILEAGVNRFRPILMTSFTTIFGLLPMALSSSELMGVPYSSMGRAMIGGLFCATFLTLFVVPLFYTYLDDLRMALRSILSGVLSRTQPIAYRGPEPAD